MSNRNLLRNGGFEEDWGTESSHKCRVFPVGGSFYETDIGNIFTPPGWMTWYKHEPGTWDQPEVRDAWVSGDPRRVKAGDKAMLLFTFNRKHDAGFMQQVRVPIGATLTLSAYANAWSNHRDNNQPDVFPHPDDPRWSEGEGVGYENFFALEGTVTNDGTRNFTFSIGIDPTGGIDPFADSVVWGQGAHIYNQHHLVPEVQAVAESSTVTVFLRSVTLWPFKHNDAYWDVVVLTADREEEPDMPGIPAIWEYPYVDSGSKLGVHGIYSNRIVEFAETAASAGAHLTVVKAVDDLGWLHAVRNVSPKTITIARLTHGNEGCQDVAAMPPEQMANVLIAPIRQKLQQSPDLASAVDFWEICNEPDPPGTEGYAALGRLMIKCMEQAEDLGIRLGLLSLNHGTPEWDEMVALVGTGMFERAYQGGHILCLHEGPTGGNDVMDLWFGDSIPGAPNVPSAGATHFRYRYLYKAVEDAGEPFIPLVISEFYAGLHLPTREMSIDEMVSRIRWWDEQTRQDYWVWGCCPFTLGPVGQWTSADWERYYPALVNYAIRIKDEPNAQPPFDVVPVPEPVDVRGLPREQYLRTYILLLPNAEMWVWHAVVDGGYHSRFTVGGSADDAGIGDLDDKEVVAVNPNEWPGDLRAFFEEHYPGTKYVSLQAENEFQLRGRVAALCTQKRGLSLAYPTTHIPAVETSEFGLWRPDRGFFHNGCDLRSSHQYFGDKILAALTGEVIVAGINPAEPGYGVQVRTRTVIGDMTVYVRYGHFVNEPPSVAVGDTVVEGQVLGKPDNTGYSTADHLHIDVKVQIGDWESYVDPRMLFSAWPTEIQQVPPKYGLHDRGGADWMLANGVSGTALVHYRVGADNPLDSIDFSQHKAAGIDVWVRLVFGYADGTGTFPPPDKADAWVANMVTSIKRITGAKGFIIGNEHNNPAEWPGGYPNPTFVLTPEYCADLFNRIRQGVGPDVWLAFSPIDPYNVLAGEFGQPADPFVWQTRMCKLTRGNFNVLAVHVKTQGAHPGEIGASDTFSHPPLTGRGYHLNMIEDWFDALPYWCKGMPIALTELNQQRQLDGNIGWERATAVEWLGKAKGYLESLNMPIQWVMVYRFDLSDPWGLRDWPEVLQVV